MIESSRRRLRIVRVLALATLWTAVAAAASPEGTVPFPGRDQAPLATAESRGFRAAAYPSEDKDHRSDLLLSTPDSDAFERIEVPGIVRSLMFAPGGTLFAVVAKIGKRLPSVTYVLEVDPGTLKGRRRITLPQSAAGMASWGNGRSVLVACRDELRSYTVPEFRSGPLYRLVQREKYP